MECGAGMDICRYMINLASYVVRHGRRSWRGQADRKSSVQHMDLWMRVVIDFLIFSLNNAQDKQVEVFAEIISEVAERNFEMMLFTFTSIR